MVAAGDVVKQVELEIHILATGVFGQAKLLPVGSIRFVCFE